VQSIDSEKTSSVSQIEKHSDSDRLGLGVRLAGVTSNLSIISCSECPAVLLALQQPGPARGPVPRASAQPPGGHSGSGCQCHSSWQWHSLPVPVAGWHVMVAAFESLAGVALQFQVPLALYLSLAVHLFHLVGACCIFKFNSFVARLGPFAGTQDTVI
jgi:hypothetical protein